MVPWARHQGPWLCSPSHELSPWPHCLSPLRRTALCQLRWPGSAIPLRCSPLFLFLGRCCLRWSTHSAFLAAWSLNFPSRCSSFRNVDKWTDPVLTANDTNQVLVNHFLGVRKGWLHGRSRRWVLPCISRRAIAEEAGMEARFPDWHFPAPFPGIQKRRAHKVIAHVAVHEEPGAECLRGVAESRGPAVRAQVPPEEGARPASAGGTSLALGSSNKRWSRQCLK